MIIFTKNRWPHLSQVASLASWLLEDRTLSQGLLPQTGTTAASEPRRWKARRGFGTWENHRENTEKHGKPWEHLGKLWENLGKSWEILGKPWEILGKLWEIMGNSGKSWENLGKPRENLGNHGKFWENYGTMMWKHRNTIAINGGFQLTSSIHEGCFSELCLITKGC